MEDTNIKGSGLASCVSTGFFLIAERSIQECQALYTQKSLQSKEKGSEGQMSFTTRGEESLPMKLLASH